MGIDWIEGTPEHETSFLKKISEFSSRILAIRPFPVINVSFIKLTHHKKMSLNMLNFTHYLFVHYRRDVIYSVQVRIPPRRLLL